MKNIILISLFLVSCVTVNPLTGKKKEDAIQSYIDLAYGYLREGQTEAAKAPLNEALKLDEYHQEANVAIANVFEKERENELAYFYYKNALRSKPKDPETNANIGNFLYKQKKYNEALKYYQVSERDPLYSNRSLVFEAIGLTYSKLGDYSKAKDYLSRALQINNSLPMSLFELSNIYFIEGKHEIALNFYKLASKFGTPNSANLLVLYKIYSYLKMKDEIASTELKMKNMFGTSREYEELLEYKKQALDSKENNSNPNIYNNQSNTNQFQPYNQIQMYNNVNQNIHNSFSR